MVPQISTQWPCFCCWAYAAVHGCKSSKAASADSNNEPAIGVITENLAPEWESQYGEWCYELLKEIPRSNSTISLLYIDLVQPQSIRNEPWAFSEQRGCHLIREIRLRCTVRKVKLVRCDIGERDTVMGITSAGKQ